MNNLRAATYLKDVKPFKTGWRIQVKVLHSWNQYTALGGESFELILADTTGVKIHASCKKPYIMRVKRHLPVGEWRLIENFSLTPATGQYRPTDHVYKMIILSNTSVSKCDLNLDDIFLSLKPFEAILNGTIKLHFLVDVIGQVLDVGNMEAVQVAGKERKKLEFTLKDINGNRIACCLWGRFAEQVEQACEEANANSVICLIRFAKINHYKGDLQLTNAFDASDVIINPTCPEGEEFLRMLTKDGLALTVHEGEDQLLRKNIINDDWNDFPEITVSEVLMANEEGRFIVQGTIYGNDKDWAWFYYGCCKCNKKVTLIKSIKKKGASNASTTEKPLFRCDTCQDNVTNVEAKFKLHLLVKDVTAEIKFMFLDTIASAIIGQSAELLVDGSYDEMEDPEVLPDAIKELVGKSFKFGVFVNKNNVFYGDEIYKVGKVWFDDEVLKLEPKSELTTYSSNISSEQVTMIDVNSQENSDVCSTPSNKRNQDESDLEDLTSATKKHCMKAIKLEKMDV